jgi:hypothetical protein
MNDVAEFVVDYINSDVRRTRLKQLSLLTGSYPGSWGHRDQLVDHC